MNQNENLPCIKNLPCTKIGECKKVETSLMNHYKNKKIALFTVARDKNISKAEFIDSVTILETVFFVHFMKFS